MKPYIVTKFLPTIGSHICQQSFESRGDACQFASLLKIANPDNTYVVCKVVATTDIVYQQFHALS